MNIREKIIHLNPSQLLVVTFLFSILLGMFMLKMPISTKTEISWLDALFTATSAMTVTGLVVVDTSQTFTIFGQIVILLLIQLGGLGIMSFAILIFIVLGKKIGMKERIVIQHALNQTSLGGVIQLVKYLFLFSFVIEFLGMIILSFRWVPQFGLKKGIYYSFFHAISAFNNAGFSIWSDSLMQFVGDPVVNLMISFLFIIGGLGFTVLADIWRNRSFQKLSLHSRLMLIGTISLNLCAMFFFFIVEYYNHKTLGSLPLLDKLWASYFQAVTTRTAGFNSLDIASMEESTIFLMIILMFIGAGSASTGGGIKLTTAIVITFSIAAFLRGRTEIQVGKRSISVEIIMRALVITMMSMISIILAVFILNLFEKHSFLEILFEAVSAFGTVGLSMGITGSLTSIGKVVIILLMFIGKVGPLTLLFTLSKPQQPKIRYPNEDVLTC